MEVKNDLNSMKCELENFSAEIKDAFSTLELESTKPTSEPLPLVESSSQTEAMPKNRVLPQPSVSKDSSSNDVPRSEPVDLSSCREAQTSTSNLVAEEDGKSFKEKEAKYKKDIFDLKVKLKELEIKMNHIKKKADEIKNDSKDEAISENLSNEKVGLAATINLLFITNHSCFGFFTFYKMNVKDVRYNFVFYAVVSLSIDLAVYVKKFI
jgi:hypothetical protein